MLGVSDVRFNEICFVVITCNSSTLNMMEEFYLLLLFKYQMDLKR